MSSGVIFILGKGVSPILAYGVKSTLAAWVIRAWVFQPASNTSAVSISTNRSIERPDPKPHRAIDGAFTCISIISKMICKFVEIFLLLLSPLFPEMCLTYETPQKNNVKHLKSQRYAANFSSHLRRRGTPHSYRGNRIRSSD